MSFKGNRSPFRGRVLAFGGSDPCKLLDYHPDSVSEDSFVALVCHSAEVQEESDYLDDSLNKLRIVHF